MAAARPRRPIWDLCSIKRRHENGGTDKDPLQRPIHHYGGISFVYAYAGTDNAPTPLRTQLMRTSHPCYVVELDREETPMGNMDSWSLMPHGVVDPGHKEHFTPDWGLGISLM